MAATNYPFKKYNYKVNVAGADSASFSEVSGFDATIDVIEYREGDDAINSPRKYPGLTKYGNVTLKWGMTASTTFYDWVIGISDGSMKDGDREKDVTIELYDDANSTVLASWKLEKAWPSKYTAPDFNASSSEIAFESIELVCYSISKVVSGG